MTTEELVGSGTGYAFAVVVGHFCVAALVSRLWAQVEREVSDINDIRPAAYHPMPLVMSISCAIVLPFPVAETIGAGRQPFCPPELINIVADGAAMSSVSACKTTIYAN